MAVNFQIAYGNTFPGMEYNDISSLILLVSSQAIQLAMYQLCDM